MTHQEEVLAEVVVERASQDKKWGGAVHDDTHSLDDFVEFIHEHANKALSAGTVALSCHRLIEVAALAVAAVESIRRKTKRQVEAIVASASGGSNLDKIRAVDAIFTLIDGYDPKTGTFPTVPERPDETPSESK